MQQNVVRVWDPFVRIFHWSLVASFAIAWLSSEDWRALHIWAGYAAGGLILLRILYGFAGSKNARFTSFVKSPAAIAAYLRDIAQGREKRYLGHNPAGGAMILALIVSMALLCVTGWMQTTAAFHETEWLEVAHELFANGLLALVALHVGGVILASVRHRENLVAAMVTGEKRA